MINKIWLAGGCFWGVEEFFLRIDGVIDTLVCYVNGKSDKTSYNELKSTLHVEAVEVSYDDKIIGLEDILQYFFSIIDPVSINKQGNDTGTQYRTGIYYDNEEDLEVIGKEIIELQKEYSKVIAIEVQRLRNKIEAEDYHKKYLRKNPNGYCHINFNKLNQVKKKLNAKNDLKSRLTPMQYHVTQEQGTEPPFDNEFHAEYRKGIYVDIINGKPLFLSSSKFNSGCGWPSFGRPIDNDKIEYVEDRSYNRIRTEVRSKESDSHLGHVFDDGPKDMGGLRYCINSASLKFIPIEKMKEEGYSEYIKLIEGEEVNG